ncbi:hypothetical protein B0T11DRAFT_346819 [Plectosphaerella cucumerina]|uniref:F-box domain-containing protein n=1 Tax=Plectosphaerella cucumerina TaxID=40658 RepID=A0A8K0TQL6_9PEZI|nr:hypothetical protein B0T11DRAFT_346819 [Plectosphaerella cucumerina]
MALRPSTNDFTSAAEAPFTDASSVEPQWATNRRLNDTESPLCRLPNELLLKIMRAASEDHVTLYMLRQACHSFAKLFGDAVFKYFHERDFSLILGQNKEKVKLHGLPLMAFRARVIDVFFSGHKCYARQLLRRDSEPEMVETTCPDTGEVRLEKRNMGELVLCDYCADDPRPEKNFHRRDEFPPSQEKLSDEYHRACEMWFGYVNACSHCNYHGRHMQQDRLNRVDLVDHYLDRRSGDEDPICLWECTTCFNDLCPEGIDICETFRSTMRPAILWHERGDFTYQQYDVLYEWKMPLFCNLLPSEKPAAITLSMVKERLEELSKGPYEDLIRMSIGPDVSFRDEVFVKPFDETRLTITHDNGKLCGRGSLDFDERNRRSGNHDRIDAGWSIEDGDLYLNLSCTFWCASQEFNRENGYGESHRFYYGEDESESDGSE